MVFLNWEQTDSMMLTTTKRTQEEIIKSCAISTLNLAISVCFSPPFKQIQSLKKIFKIIKNNGHRYIAEILPKRRKTLSNQSINQSINQSD